MPRQTKSGGPPYTDPPHAVFIVIVRPWSTAIPPARGQADFDRVATWVSFVLWEARGREGRIPMVEYIYRMRTRDEIIGQLPLNTDISPLLGKHYWAIFAQRWAGESREHQSTLVFSYNWRNNGDPAMHNWEEFSPEVLPLDSVPIKSPYPCPTWTPAPPSLTSFVISTPPPPAQPTQYLLQSSDASRVKKEEERNPEVLISVKTEPDAETKVKVEVSSEFSVSQKEYKPSPGLLAAFETLGKVPQAPGPSTQHQNTVTMIKEPPEEDNKALSSDVAQKPSSPQKEYKPSPELLAAFATINQAPHTSNLSSPQRNPIDQHKCIVNVKREHLEEELLSEVAQGSSSPQGEYRPSAGLLAAFATLGQIPGPSSPPRNLDDRHKNTMSVKKEPLADEDNNALSSDTIHEPFFPQEEYRPSAELLAAFMAPGSVPRTLNLRANVDEHEHAVSVKREFSDEDSKVLQKRIKLEEL